MSDSNPLHEPPAQAGSPGEARPAYFLCGIGGSGMLPLAMILKESGASVEGSDRSLDQGRLAAKFASLEKQGVVLHPQDGSGVRRSDQIVVASAAVEETVPDIARANALGCMRLTRAELLAQLVNAAPRSIGVAGTSGKSTTTGMIAWILHSLGFHPTVMNGAVMTNFLTPDAPFASALVGSGGIFVSEVDESDGSIARYSPTIAVLNNISLDHKSMEELRALFGGFIARAQTAVINLDNDEARRIAEANPAARTFSLHNPAADLSVRDVTATMDGVSCTVVERATGAQERLSLGAPGRYNVSNALGALLAAMAVGAPFAEAVTALSTYRGVRRRLERVGDAAGVTVFDDFAHNPDKISASLAALTEFRGRLIVMFQPHGFGPLRLMKQELTDAFVNGLRAEDLLLMPEPVYFGGTVDRSVGSSAIVDGVTAGGRNARALASREACADAILLDVRPGDRVVVMGARDDTLTEFATNLLTRIGAALSGT
ncbi:UDP-N-acetylmuramate--alanine ligase [bacterium]|nr:UDP-N-acetylmuramate--alanine ligase [bacterium]